MRFSKYIPAFAVIASILFGCASAPETAETAPAPVVEDSVFTFLEKGEDAKAREFFQGRADINGTDSQGRTALHIAAEKKKADMIAFLLASGAKVDSRNSAGKTALEISCELKMRPLRRCSQTVALIYSKTTRTAPAPQG
jgi:hypothetical protein